LESNLNKPNKNRVAFGDPVFISNIRAGGSVFVTDLELSSGSEQEKQPIKRKPLLLSLMVEGYDNKAVAQGL